MAIATLPFTLLERTEVVRPEPQIHTRQAIGGARVEIGGVKKSFGENEVLRGLSLSIPAGQFVAVIGRSGCGKSTLLRLIADLERPSSGTLSLAGANGGKASTRIVFQEHRLLPWARVVENVEVGLGDTPPAERRATALAMLAEVGLESRANDWPSVLSGGQRQRVALARALASRPQLMALDEPLGALDALTRIEMQSLIERIWLRQGFTAVLVTHDVAEALALADRVVLIDEGRITLDVSVPLERPRRRGSVELAKLEGKILDQLLKKDHDGDETHSHP
ncbi:aliphatic sulfonates import ATP-binding protein SsuB [Variibacter gotjawalensis]|uniref:Aliphatic sulfonates import ATP-binding protein SsuB n=1 Tax=Variibacter gotjawalensis TaxID=1333996 RepID=A0A0S3Q171_9BRAD|nr:ATP-binding cassette domain-containing protein [Variibacter gotjawalensis]NIK47753.1 sulfonate transport system ATP-binding protein [Variibacter gotjawalensis]RZS49642.1 sulfonate transport system ATP-binding protein [Variibacter gotjawalensis]BAT61906.1 aliphatic sulfonates import ATP-binding protein SsuB [Variibacter gotjawalensis]